MTTRDNGLHAGSYAPLTALANTSVDAVLDSLRQAGVAAYVVAGEPTELGRVMLWVDSGATARARDVLHAGKPSPPPSPGTAGALPGAVPGHHGESEPLDEDALWRSIVASFDAPAADPVPRWPESESLDEPSDDTEDSLGTGRVLRRVEPRSPERHSPAPRDGEGRDEGRGGEGRVEGPGGEGHFVPPPPPPLPRPDAVTRWAWLGLLGGPLFLFVSALLGRHLADWLVLAALGAFVVGFVTLVARMKDRPPRDSGGDDGAVV